MPADATGLCEYPELLEYVSTNFIGEEEPAEGETEPPPPAAMITTSQSAAELSPVSSPVRGPGEDDGGAPAAKLMSKSVLFGRRTGADKADRSRTPSPSKALSSFYAATTMATAATHMKKTAQSRREKRNADWAEVGYSDKVAPRRLNLDEVNYASKACGALYQWATTAVDTAKALQKLYPVKKECDALNVQKASVAAQLTEAEDVLNKMLAQKGRSEAEVEKARAELARLRALLKKLQAEAKAKEQAAAAAARAKEEADAKAAESANEQAAKEAREREEHERQQAAVSDAAERRKQSREEAVKRAAEKIEVTKVDVVIKQSLTFEKGQVVVQDMAIPALIAVAHVMKDHKDCKVNVRGRPDPNDGGNSDYQVRVSADRAQAVCDWLVSQGGVSISRLRTTNASQASGGSGASGDVLEDDWCVQIGLRFRHPLCSACLLCLLCLSVVLQLMSILCCCTMPGTFVST